MTYQFHKMAMPNNLPWEELRVKIALVATAHKVLGPAAAVWMWGNVGLPMPPRHLLPGWYQSDMFQNP